MSKKDEKKSPFTVITKQDMIKLQTKVKELKQGFFSGWKSRYTLAIIIFLLAGGIFASTRYLQTPEIERGLEEEEFKVESSLDDMILSREDNLNQEALFSVSNRDSLKLDDENNRVSQKDSKVREDSTNKVEQEAEKRVEEEEEKALASTNIQLNLLSPVSGEYSNHWQWYQDQTLGAWRFNPGVDIIAKAGAVVTAAESGEVVKILDDDYFGYKVIIKHNNKLKTVYSNLDEVELRIEDNISRGEKIGLVKDNNYYEQDYIRFKIEEDGDYIAPNKYLDSISD